MCKYIVVNIEEWRSKRNEGGHLLAPSSARRWLCWSRTPVVFSSWPGCRNSSPSPAVSQQLDTQSEHCAYYGATGVAQIKFIIYSRKHSGENCADCSKFDWAYCEIFLPSILNTWSFVSHKKPRPQIHTYCHTHLSRVHDESDAVDSDGGLGDVSGENALTDAIGRNIKYLQTNRNKIITEH